MAKQTGGTISRCYYLDNVSVGVGYVDYSVSTTPETTKLTHDQMTKIESFDGFGASWTMDGSAEYLYPEFCATYNRYELIYRKYAPGDIDGNEEVNSDDVVQLLLHISLPDMFPIDADADFTGDGKVNSDDVVQLLLHISLPDMFPLDIAVRKEDLMV